MFSFAWKGEEAKTTGIYSEHQGKTGGLMDHSLLGREGLWHS